MSGFLGSGEPALRFNGITAASFRRKDDRNGTRDQLYAITWLTRWYEPALRRNQVEPGKGAAVISFGTLVGTVQGSSEHHPA
jgi:hypothetical protein